MMSMLPYIESLSPIGIIGIVFAILWTLAWKGYALWTAAHRKHIWWFIVLLILNTFGILEIIYLFAVAKKSVSDIETDSKLNL